MESIALDALWTLEPTRKGWVTPFLAIFILWDSRVCVSSSDYYYVLSDIEVPIDETFGFCTTLGVPNVDPDNSHVKFRRCFDYSWFEHKSNVIENMVLLDNEFNVT